MAQIDSTYSDLNVLTAGFCGKTSFNSSDQQIVNSFYNQAARRIYRASDFWERFLVVAQPRSVVRGYIATTEDSYQVYGAGSDSVNGLYVRSGSENSKPRYYRYSTNNETPTHKLYWTGSRWEIKTLVAVTLNGEPVTINGEQVFAADTVIYLNTGTDATPPTGAWTDPSDTASSDDKGEDPGPAIEALADIDTFLSIYPYDNVNDRACVPYTFHVGHRGANIQTRDGRGTVYVTYKKKLSDVYGDGTGGTTSDVPQEWVDYMALDAARKWQISQRQSNPNAAYSVLAASEVQSALDDSLMQLESQQTIDTIGKRLYTNLTHDRTLR